MRLEPEGVGVLAVLDTQIGAVQARAKMASYLVRDPFVLKRLAEGLANRKFCAIFDVEILACRVVQFSLA